MKKQCQNGPESRKNELKTSKWPFWEFATKLIRHLNIVSCGEVGVAQWYNAWLDFRVKQRRARSVNGW